MTRLIVFLSVLATFVLALVMFSYKSLPVSNEKFDIKATEEKHREHSQLVETLLAPKEKVAEVEVVVKEYAPVVDLNTPQLVSGHKLFNQCISCHGKGGEGKSSQKAPFIGGQFDWYIEKQLTEMKSGARNNVSMAVIVKGLSPQDMKDLAAYVSLLPWKKPVETAAAVAE
ncbi:MAG: c-type cytochrome [Bacteriovoracaceae bacterium]|nr:c-type cytochrome [Bacteriovoracaceae bacterium]